MILPYSLSVAVEFCINIESIVHLGGNHQVWQITVVAQISCLLAFCGLNRFIARYPI